MVYCHNWCYSQPVYSRICSHDSGKTSHVICGMNIAYRSTTDSEVMTLIFPWVTLDVEAFFSAALPIESTQPGVVTSPADRCDIQHKPYPMLRTTTWWNTFGSFYIFVPVIGIIFTGSISLFVKWLLLKVCIPPFFYLVAF